MMRVELELSPIKGITSDCDWIVVSCYIIYVQIHVGSQRRHSAESQFPLFCQFPNPLFHTAHPRITNTRCPDVPPTIGQGHPRNPLGKKILSNL